MHIVRLDRSALDEVVATLCDAFHDYPVMRFVIGDAGNRYDRCMRDLVGYFAFSRLSRSWPVLGVRENGRLLAAAYLNPPERVPEPEESKERFRRLVDVLGTEAMGRYAEFAASGDPFVPAEPHYYLGMIGVRREHQGRGLGRLLLDEVHGMSAEHPRSTGVLLTTETQANLALYERFGYAILGCARLEGLDSWSLFRAEIRD